MTTPYLSLKAFFEPRSIAIIGASRKPGSLGHMFLKAVLDYSFTGKIYPVHPSGEVILGVPSFPSVAELPEVPDLAVIMVRRDLVRDALIQCGEKGIRHVIIITAGFREVGEDGKKMEAELVRIAREYGIRFMGPNCMGLFNTHPQYRLNASFSPTQPLPGAISFVSQSGALAVAVLETANRAHMGFAKMVSVGNKADLTELDFLEYLGQDPESRVIMLYQEGLDDPRRFLTLARHITPEKPVVVLKGGRSESASRAAASHTGALATPTAIVQGMYRQAGIIEATGYEDFVFTAQAMAYWPPFSGKRIAVITNAGGPGILAVDALARAGLHIPAFSPQLQNRLRQLLPPEAAVGNPVDMIASATETTYAAVVEAVLQSGEADALLIVIVRPPVNTTGRKIADALKPLFQRNPLPAGIVLLQEWDADAGISVFHDGNLPVFPSPEVAAQAFQQAAEYYAWRKTVEVQTESPSRPSPSLPVSNETLVRDADPRSGVVAPERVLDLFQHAGLPLAPYQIVTQLADAQAFQAEGHTPVVLKLLAREISHKSDVGGVQLNIDTPQKLQAAWEHLARIHQEHRISSPLKVLIQQQVTGQREMILGLQREPGFGPVMMIGWGGILVEVLRQVVFRVWPFTTAEAMRMVEELPAAELLQGVRGMGSVAMDKLANLILRMGEMGAAYPSVASLEVNPLIISDDGQHLWIVDARMVVHTNDTSGNNESPS